MRKFVFSHTLRQDDSRNGTVAGANSTETVATIRAASGKDIWLFGVGSLFGSLLDAGLVDAVEVAVMPVPRPSKIG
jgi:dihydrofolate reductase